MSKGRRPRKTLIATAQSQRLRSARHAHFPTARAAAKKMSIAYPTYVSHENGNRGFGVEEAHIYGAMFEVHPSWLLGLDPGLALGLDKALPEVEAANDKLTFATDPSRASQLRDEIETAYDFMTMLDKAGDGIGGDVGHGVSAVALAARSALDNARDMLKAMEASRGSRACEGA
jgi:hypothetical protein